MPTSGSYLGAYSTNWAIPMTMSLIGTLLEL